MINKVVFLWSLNQKSPYLLGCKNGGLSGVDRVKRLWLDSPISEKRA